MKKLSVVLASLWLLFAPFADAQTINNLGAGRGSVAGTDLFPSYQGANPAVRPSAAQIAAYVYGLMSGSCTTSGTGTIACPFSGITGNATLAQLPQLIANSIYINPTGSTAAPQSIAVPACANDGAHGLVYVNGTGLQCASISGSGAVSSVTGGIGVTVIPTTGAVVVNTPANSRNTTATTDTITSSDKGTIVTESNAASIAVAITTAGFVNTDYFTVKNLSALAGVATYTPSSGTIDGAASLVCQPGQSADLTFNGTNFNTLANNCRLDVSGTAGMGTSAIASGACATVVTVSAPGVATTDTVMFGYNGDPTAVTGYGASATGAVLTVYPYPSSGNVNVKVCNSSSGSITPSALTLNWRVVR